MASSSRKGGAGGKKSVTVESTRRGRPAAKKATPAGKTAAASKRRRKGETGVITVKRGSVLPRRGRVRAPQPLAPDAGVAPEVVAVLDDTQPYAELEILAPTGTVPAAQAQPMADVLAVAAVADDVTDEIPLADLVAMTTANVGQAEPRVEAALPPAPVVEPEPPAAQLPAVTPAGPNVVSWLMAKLRRLARSRA